MYFLRRLMWMVPTFIGVITITFFLTKLRPDPVALKAMNPEAMSDRSLSAEVLERQRAYYGYDKPAIVQYFIMLKNLALFDFSESRIDHRPVIEKIGEALPYTLALNITTIFIVYLISVPLGVYSAVKDRTHTDNAITFFLYVLYSLPQFWTALFLLRYLSGGDYLDIFPLGGFFSDDFEKYTFFEKIYDVLWHLFLPVVVSVYGSFAFLSRFVKGSFIETLRSDYVRTARAKGLSRRSVLYVHALRNSLIPFVTIVAGLLPALFSGSVIIEQIFSIPGMGKLAYDSIYANDDPVIIAVVMISALLTMVGILISDLVYTLVDPRISFSGGNEK